MAKAIVLLARGFEEIEAVSVIDTLRRGGVEVVVASIHAEEEVVGAHGLPVRADVLLSAVESEEFDAVILPGGGDGTANLKASDAVAGLLRRQRERGGLLCAICAAPTVLVAAGVLDPEVHVTCYPTCQLELDREWSPSPVVADGTVITAQAPGSALLFSLVVLQTMVGAATTRQVARGMVTDVPS